jgi:phage gp36-like protein
MPERHMYHTYENLLDKISAEELRQLVDDENVGSIVVTPVPNAAYLRIVAAGNHAQALIDGYCRGNYTVPFVTVPDMVRELSIELTIYNCMMRKKEIALSEEQNRNYKNALDILERIQEGKVKLLNDTNPAPSFVSNKAEADRTFSDAVLEQF